MVTFISILNLTSVSDKEISVQASRQPVGAEEAFFLRRLKA